MRMRHLLLGLVLLSVVSSFGCLGRRFAAYRCPPPSCPPSAAMLPPTAVPAYAPPPSCCP